MSTTTLKIKTSAEFESLLEKAVSLNSLPRYGDCKLTVSSWLPWLTKDIRVYSGHIHKVWPESESILRIMQNFSIAGTKKQGLKVLREAYAQTRTEPSDSFWVFEQGFFWHSEITGMAYQPESSSVEIQTAARGTFTTPYSLVKANNMEVAKFLMQTTDLALLPETTIEALDLCGVMKLPRARSSIKKIPNAVSDILSITRAHPMTKDVEIIMKSQTSEGLEVCCCDLTELNHVFPHFIQALLTTNDAYTLDEVIRASYMREWWRNMPPDNNELLVFSVGDNWSNLLIYDLRPVREAQEATLHKWSDLTAVGMDSEHRLALTFSNSQPDSSSYCNIGKGSDQYKLLGLEKIVAMLTSLDISGSEAACPFYRALCGQNKSTQNLPTVDLDDSTFL